MSTISREDYERFWYPLSYFFGAWLGDGHYVFNAYTRTYQVGMVSMDNEIIQSVYDTLSSHFSDINDIKVREEVSKAGTKLLRLRVNDKVFTDFVCRTTAYKTMLPEFIWEAPKEVKLDMLTGLMDTDGTIVVQKQKECKDGFFYTLKFSGTKVFVTQFPDLCRVVGIKITSEQEEYHSNPNHATRSVFNISLPSAVENGFNFRCKRKQVRLDDYKKRSLSRYKRMVDTKSNEIVPSETIRQTAL